MSRRPGAWLLAGGFAVTVLLGGCVRTAPDETSEAPQQPVEEPEIHPRFSLTADTLESLTSALDPALARKITDDPETFLGLVADIAGAPPDLLVRVDKDHPTDSDYAPAEIVSLDDHADRLDLSREGHRLSRLALDDLFAMVDAARADNVVLLISSAYRSYEYQKGVYEYWVETLGQEEADRTSARPGTSQHQLGTTIDFGCICDDFARTEASGWLADNAWRFGFSLSYPEGLEALTGYTHESWHYRYIGRPGARLAKMYFDGVQHRLLEFVDKQMAGFVAHLIDF